MKSYILKTEDTRFGVRVSLLSGEESSVWTYITDGVSSYKDFSTNIEILQKVVSNLVKGILTQDELLSEKERLYKQKIGEATGLNKRSPVMRL